MDIFSFSFMNIYRTKQNTAWMHSITSLVKNFSYCFRFSPFFYIFCFLHIYVYFKYLFYKMEKYLKSIVLSSQLAIDQSADALIFKSWGINKEITEWEKCEKWIGIFWNVGTKFNEIRFSSIFHLKNGTKNRACSIFHS